MTEEQKKKRAAYMRDYRAANPERVRETERRTRLKNREKCLERQRQYYARNREECRRKQKEYRRANSAKIVKQVTRWQKANHERTKATKRKSARKAYAANPRKFITEALERIKRAPEKARARSAFRRAMKRNATPPWVDKAALQAIYDEAAALGMSVDHIIPLKHQRICGLHVPWNLQLLSHSENASKGNRYELESISP